MDQAGGQIQWPTLQIPVSASQLEGAAVTLVQAWSWTRPDIPKSLPAILKELPTICRKEKWLQRKVTRVTRVLQVFQMLQMCILFGVVTFLASCTPNIGSRSSKNHQCLLDPYRWISANPGWHGLPIHKEPVLLDPYLPTVSAISTKTHTFQKDLLHAFRARLPLKLSWQLLCEPTNKWQIKHEHFGILCGLPWNLKVDKTELQHFAVSCWIVVCTPVVNCSKVLHCDVGSWPCELCGCRLWGDCKRPQHRCDTSFEYQ